MAKGRQLKRMLMYIDIAGSYDIGIALLVSTALSLDIKDIGVKSSPVEFSGVHEVFANSRIVDFGVKG